MILVDTTIRLATIDDHRFILDSWVKSMAQIYPNNYDKEFKGKYRLHCQQLLDKSLAMIQALTTDSEEIISYVVFQSFHHKLVINYAYTKADARRQGKVRELLQYLNPENHLVIFTHPCRNENIMEAFVSRFHYDPSILELI